MLLEGDRQRFWAKVDKDGPVPPHMPHLGNCWVWTGGRIPSGYGKMSLDCKSVLAHRVSWHLAHGGPAQLLVLHRCDNPACVRPDHLFEGTCKDNTEDMVKKGRCSYGVAPVDRNGANNGRAVLDWELVRWLRDQRPGKAKIDRLAKERGVRSRTLTEAMEGVTWRKWSSSSRHGRRKGTK